MKRWILASLLGIVGCGTSNPVLPEPEPVEITFENVSVTELGRYIQSINAAYPAIEKFYAEYGGITGEAVGGFVTQYWTRQYTLIMIARIHAISAKLYDLRPENPYLRQLHINEMEGAFVDYLDGVTFFENNIDFLSVDVLNGVNQRMGAGNVHLIRMQIFLSDLAGRDVVLGAQQGPTDGQGTDF
jgi:hypothetical protein